MRAKRFDETDEEYSRDVLGWWSGERIITAVLVICLGMLLALLTACGPANNRTCQLVYLNERQVLGDTRCGPNEAMRGFIPPSTILCAEVQTICPKD